ncbi:arylsulfatase [Algoriphagus zhangzhouensis]|uniref:Arylsulfatase n=1 Tax=Algoriphagus zhangzhouensis TaxID=1073327 RepID=A0A1M7ZEM1_9BACT|nr:arylsulfatase [Algoriphagus zhangzhouensis]TDY46051.1 arylsulfatase [Algoriphagus zhangzhouensis]SHO63292.1 arylsulfatase [Algoriphagus zhangzhouensis]
MKKLLFIILFAIGNLAMAQEKPNILVIMSDDMGWQNLSIYGLGTMGYTTPNIDRIGREGIVFTDHYAQPSCTAGRVAFITGQYPIRSGMTTVGRPGDDLGLKKESPTLAEILKGQGYATAQFGKNHLGDQNENLPTVHGFDLFYGNLYHQNVSEEYADIDYPSDPNFEKNYGPRGIIHSVASSTYDDTVDPRFGVIGNQKILSDEKFTIDWMKTIDKEFFAKTEEFMSEAQKDDKPFFVWLNPVRMHMHTHLSDESRYLAKDYTSGDDKYGSGVIEHDQMVGDLLEYMEKNGLLENTIVVYTTDNGPEHEAMFHAGATPFRGDKMTTFEGGLRVPTVVMWKDHIKPGQYLNGIQSHMDLFTTLASAAGVDNVAEKVATEKKQYIDGVDNLDYWLGKEDKSKRQDFLYFYESNLMAIRMGNWKVNFQTTENYYGTYTKYKFPLMFNLRMDPFESYDNTDAQTWAIQSKQFVNDFIMKSLNNFTKSMVEYPPVQRAKSLDFSSMMDQIMSNVGKGGH